MPQESLPQQQPASAPRNGLSKSLILRILIVSLALVVIVMLAIRYWPDSGAPAVNQNTNNGTLTNTSSGLQLRTGDDQAEDPEDTDGDGLTDAEEAEIGTNPTLVDSDADFLFDREEVEVYGTNPLVADSDRDGFLDGEEVQDRFNPNGPGSLLDFENSRTNLNASQ